MSTHEVKKVVKNYAQALRANGFSFATIYLFGSYASGKARQDSDIDVAVIVKNVGSYLDETMLLWKLAGQTDSRIEPILIESKDFQTRGTQMAYEARKSGLKVV